MPGLSTYLSGMKIAFRKPDSGKIAVVTFPDVHHPVITDVGQNPTLSPDGERVAFTVTSLSDRFMVCDTRTGRKIGEHPGFSPHFSADGSQIAFINTGRTGTEWTLSTVAASLQGGDRPLIPRGVSSKDAPTAVLHSCRDGFVAAYGGASGNNLYVLHPDGTIVRKIFLPMRRNPGRVPPKGCALSNDSTHVLFEDVTGEQVATGNGNGGPLTGLYLFEVRSRSVWQMTSPGMGGCNPVWYDQNIFLFAGQPNQPNSELGIYAQSIAAGSRDLLIPGVGDYAVARAKK